MFSYLQKIGKALMVPVAVLPAAAIMLGLGYWIDPTGWGANSQLAAFLIKAGAAVIDNMPILFAVGVAYGISKDKDGKTSKKAQNSQDKFDKFKKNQGTTGDRKYNIDYDHVLGGDINYKSGKVTGGHTLLKGDVRIVKKYGKPSKSGVYKASIEVKTPDGNWQAKTSNGGINTMFPEDWDEARVIDEINSAWENRKDLKGRDSNMWQGISKSGVLIRGYKSPRITAYPVFEGDR